MDKATESLTTNTLVIKLAIMQLSPLFSIGRYYNNTAIHHYVGFSTNLTNYTGHFTNCVSHVLPGAIMDSVSIMEDWSKATTNVTILPPMIQLQE